MAKTIVKVYSTTLIFLISQLSLMDTMCIILNIF